MARMQETNGIKDTVERLFGNDNYRKILAKLVSEHKIFKPHLENNGEKPYTFKRTKACDNLIQNVLLLGEALNSYSFAIELVKGNASRQKISQEIEKEKAKMEVKFKAYGYWLSRFESLNQVLTDGFDAEAVSIEDSLSVDSTQNIFAPTSPYALRAVRLLEKVEEEGRVTKLSLEQQTEKAWALYRLGLRQQAIDLSEQITNEDPSSSDAWLLLALDTLSNQKEANQEYCRYAFEEENADPLSAHERWAEEMQDEAISKYHTAKKREKEIIFSAFLHWPKYKTSYNTEEFKSSAAREQILNHCVEWLFSLLIPYNGYASNHSISLQRAYKMHGLEPEFTLSEASRFSFNHKTKDSPHGLNDIEISVAQLLCAEFDKKQRIFSYRLPQQHQHLLGLKLLHIRYALGLSGYDDARRIFIEEVPFYDSHLLTTILNNKWLLNAFTTHLTSTGLHDYLDKTNQLKSNLDKSRESSRYFIEMNLLRKAFDHAYSRSQYEDCVTISQTAGVLSTANPEQSPRDMIENGDSSSNILTTAFWKYLELLSASHASDSYADTEHIPELIVESLLSVSEPSIYFSDESHFMITHYDYDCPGEWYVPAYGRSILESGTWLASVQKIISNKYSDDTSIKKAQETSKKLAELVCSSPWDDDYT